jgi:hypothetical protein
MRKNGKMVRDLSYRTTLGPVGARILTLVYLANLADEVSRNT